MHSHRETSKATIAVVGGELLLGKEVREVIESAIPGVKVIMIASEQGGEASVIAITREEPVVMSSLQSADLLTANVAVLTGSPESSLKAYDRIRAAASAPAIIDLTGALEERPGARLRAPAVENIAVEPGNAVQVIAHPAAIAVALFLTGLQKSARIRRSVVQIFEPVSERGQAGLDELQKQTVGLLSFKPLQKDVYDAQVSFNMLPQYGSESPHSLAAIEQKIDRHLASLLAGANSVPMPSLRLIQAPVFHGYSISFWVEFEMNPDLAAIEHDLASSEIDVRGKEHEPPTNVGVAGQSGITVGAMAADRNDPRACWFWVVADNLRIAADNAAEVLSEILK